MQNIFEYHLVQSPKDGKLRVSLSSFKISRTVILFDRKLFDCCPTQFFLSMEQNVHLRIVYIANFGDDFTNSRNLPFFSTFVGFVVVQFLSVANYNLYSANFCWIFQHFAIVQESLWQVFTAGRLIVIRTCRVSIFFCLFLTSVFVCPLQLLMNQQSKYCRQFWSDCLSLFLVAIYLWLMIPS